MPGVGKGVVSGTVGGICEPIGHAAQVRAEGSPVIRHLDRFWMNNRNTVGEAIFVRDTATYAPPEDDDPLPGSLVMSDAMPEPLIMGAQYAQARDVHGGDRLGRLDAHAARLAQNGCPKMNARLRVCPGRGMDAEGNQI
ncbi:PAAR-like domain-containing protein [Roseinatronobacter alkalisoli]|uniref:DUF4150 domain-containing protein n=1 Tax=Roseinatronobacter alkalisoli TaxID=3028235 RepID=A0ABT5TED5_9RHOB|nr:PAAR-like domain-containing protein [Roseinatronobacter sp. HJB301]MDD7973484.1 DUF4150 domain-containing protein [Roseinatronobacter sp. HJB301]